MACVRSHACAHRCNTQDAESLRRVDIHTASQARRFEPQFATAGGSTGRRPDRLDGSKPLSGRPPPADVRTLTIEMHSASSRFERRYPHRRAPARSAAGTRPSHTRYREHPRRNPRPTGPNAHPHHRNAQRFESLREPDIHIARCFVRLIARAHRREAQQYESVRVPVIHTETPARARSAARLIAGTYGAATLSVPRKSAPGTAVTRRTAHPHRSNAQRCESVRGADIHIATPASLYRTRFAPLRVPDIHTSPILRRIAFPCIESCGGPDTTSKRAFHPVECSMLTVESHSFLCRFAPRFPHADRRIGIGNPTCGRRCSTRPRRTNLFAHHSAIRKVMQIPAIVFL